MILKSITVIAVACVVFAILTSPGLSPISYIMMSYIFGFDSAQEMVVNFDGEVEDGVFTHRFIRLNRTYHGLPVEATYHVVECGKFDAEPIVFGHGLCENWKVWKHIMTEFCSTHRVVAFDSEGMGQSSFPYPIRDLPKGLHSGFNITERQFSTQFMADMQMEMLRQLGIHQFNLVTTDYSFWTTLAVGICPL